ncbi:MAG: protein-L-isoaspartate(D-aspartate) O-methyltransferase [Desulfomonilaceae bacterium]
MQNLHEHDEYALARNAMVDSQLIARGIRDPRVLHAMRTVPRHLFVDERLRVEAYDDNPLSIGYGQTISQPYMVAIMTELLALGGSERVLEIGTGSGYQTAVLALLCKWVYTIERIHALSTRAQETLARCGYQNITFKVGDGTRGWPSEAPFEGIIVTAGAPTIPQVLFDQLTEGGILVIPVGDRFSQTLKRVVKINGRMKTESHTPCRFVDLVGQYAWRED